MSELTLSRLVLNPRAPEVQRDLADAQEMHRTIMRGFPDIPSAAARAELGILYRLEVARLTGVPTLLVQSGSAPDWSKLPAGYLLQLNEPNPASKAIGAHYAAISSGMRLAFRLRANPTRKIETKTGPDGVRRNGRRVELTREEDQHAWLARRAEQAGFAIDTMQVQPDAALGAHQRARRTAGRSGLTHYAVLFEGTLTVMDTDCFKAALVSGIGPGKAYGFGLLSIAPVRGGA